MVTASRITFEVPASDIYAPTRTITDLLLACLLSYDRTVDIRMVHLRLAGMAACFWAYQSR